MKRHYHRYRGWSRCGMRRSRPVYYMPMGAQEIRERRVLYGLIGTVTMLMALVVLWAVGSV